jgi:hypothetical protein
MTYAGEARARQAPGNSAAIWGTEGDGEAKLDEAKVQVALIKLQEAEGTAPEDAEPDGDNGTGHRAGRYHGLGADGTVVTPEEMEAYRRFRARAADPMTAMRDGGGAKAPVGGYNMV